MKGFDPITPLLLTDGVTDHRSVYGIVMLCRQPNLSGLSQRVLASQSGPLSTFSTPGTQDATAAATAEKGLHMQKVGSGSVRAALAELVALPCLFTLWPRPGAAREAPRIKWTKVRTASGQRQDLPILVAKDNVVRVAKGWQGRVSLPAYPRHRVNATLLLGPLRASDSGLYRCQVVRGIEDEQDLVPLEVTGQLGEGEGPRLGWGSPSTECDLRNYSLGNSLVVQWLGLCTFTAEGPGSIPGQGAKIPQAKKKKEKKRKRNHSLNSDLLSVLIKSGRKSPWVRLSL